MCAFKALDLTSIFRRLHLNCENLSASATQLTDLAASTANNRMQQVQSFPEDSSGTFYV